MTAAIELAGVRKVYRRTARRSRMGTLKSALLSAFGPARPPAPGESFVALDGVDLQVGRGESLGVIGSNGSGKSTLLKLVAGILRPTEGRVAVRGRVAALLELGAGFHPEISGRENVIINGVMLGLTRRQVEDRFDDIVRFSGLADFIDEPVKNYSSGMYVRLGFAVAVHTDPEVLLVDEVLAVGDEEFSHRCLAKIREIQSRGTTILLVTHSLGLVVEFCDRAAWLDAGRIVALGDPREVVDRYRMQVAEDEGRRAAAPPQAALPAERESSGPPVALVPSEPAALPPAATEVPVPVDRAPKRWGTGAARLHNVRLERSGAPAGTSVPAGKPVAIAFDVEPAAPLTDFVFGIAVHDAGGTWLLGTNTDLEGMAPATLDGPATVRVEFPSLDLVSGDYDLDVAVHARDGTPYDYVRGALRFRVVDVAREVGLWRAPRRWSFDGRVRWDRTPPPR